MYQREKLEEAIKTSGLRKRYIAEKINMRYDTMLAKISGRQEWKVSEVQKIGDLIGITSDQRNTIFFG